MENEGDQGDSIAENADKADDSEDPECSICLCPFNSLETDVAKLDGCLHIFHFQCIMR